MTTTQVFRNDNDQILIIPQELITEKKEFIIGQFGDIFVAYPADDPWATARQAIGDFPEDFLIDREQPLASDEPEREKL